MTVIQSDSLIQAHIGDTNFVILDVRQIGPFEAGHIQNAINIDYYDPNFSSLINALDHNKIYLVHCQSGGRSAITFSMMQTQLFREVYNMLGGMSAWVGAGYPVVTSSNVVANMLGENNSTVFPNPLSDVSYLNLPDEINSGRIEIYNVTGKKLKAYVFSSNSIQLFGNEFESGLYYYMFVSDKNQILSGSFIVK